MGGAGGVWVAQGRVRDLGNISLTAIPDDDDDDDGDGEGDRTARRLPGAKREP